MNKHKEHILEMIYRIVGIEFLDLAYGDSKYILSNLIAKFSNSDRIYMSQRVKDILELNNFPTSGEVKYLSQFYGRKCMFYKKHNVQFVAEHIIPCGILLGLIMGSDKSREIIRAILEYNRVVMLLKEEDRLLQKAGLGNRTADDFCIGERIWGRYEQVGINITENYFTNVGPIFR